MQQWNSDLEKNAKLVTMVNMNNKVGETYKLACDPSHKCVSRCDAHCVAMARQKMLSEPFAITAQPAGINFGSWG